MEITENYYILYLLHFMILVLLLRITLSSFVLIDLFKFSSFFNKVKKLPWWR